MFLHYYPNKYISALRYTLYTGCFFIWRHCWLLLAVLVASCGPKAPSGVGESPTKKNSLVTQRGDTIPTGVPLSIHGSPQPPSGFEAPIPTKLESYPLRSNVLDSINYSDYPIVEDSLQVLVPGENGIQAPDTFHTTGVALKVIEPEFSKALPLRYKEGATADVQYLDVEQGLNSSFANCVFMDSKGMLWIGTGSGISIYTGQFIKHYTRESGLPDDFVQTVFEDSQQRIWIGTKYGGAICYDGIHFKHFSTQNGLKSNNISAFAEGKNGEIWMGLWKGGICKFDGTKLVGFSAKNGFPETRVLGVDVDGQGNVWAAINGGGGIAKYDGHGVTYYFKNTHPSKEGGLKEQYFNTLMHDRLGNLWLGTWREFTYIKDGLAHAFSCNAFPPNNIILKILQDRNGIYWFAVYGKGLVRYDGNTITVIDEAMGLTLNNVNGVCEDQAGNIWVSTDGGGVCRFRQNSFSHINAKNGLMDNGVNCMLELGHGKIMLGTQKGLNIYDGKTLHQVKYGNDNMQENEVKALLKDDDGGVWFGTMGTSLNKWKDGAIYRFDGKQGKVGDHNIIAMAKRVPGEFWFGSLGGGVTQYKDNIFTQFKIGDGFKSRVINYLFADSRALLWMGTDGEGLIRYDGQYFTYYTVNEGLPGNVVTHISEGRNGELYVSTNSGCSKVTMGKDGEPIFNNFVESEGLLDNNVSSVSGDHLGNIWIATDKGLQLLKPISGNVPASEKWELAYYEKSSFAEAEGVFGTNFLWGSALQDSLGRAWFGSGKELVMVDLGNFNIQKDIPRVQLQTIKINNRYIDYRNLNDASGQLNPIDSSHLAKAVSAGDIVPFKNLPKELKLPFSLNHLTFYFFGTEWSDPLRLQYSYMLEGLDESWSPPRSDFWAEYRNVPYGTYIFKVRAVSTAQVWSEPFSYTITVYPPWWHTWWARLVFVILAAMAIWGYVRWRTNALLRRQEELEKTVAERTAEVVQEKNEVVKQRDEVEKQRKISEELLLNILPAETAQELKDKGSSDARLFDEVTVLFCDIKGFTQLSEKLTPHELVAEINECFSAFDNIMLRHGVEKIKTIGDAYMAAGGLPSRNNSHAHDTVKAALEVQAFMGEMKRRREAEGRLFFEIRMGVHTGPVVAGIVGIKKFQYDIWGDTVNVANRMQSSGEAGKVNISESTYQLVKDDFACHYRGKVSAKGKGEIDMYFVEMQG